MVRFITVDNETRKVSEWASIKGIDARLIMSRLRAGWSEEDAVNEPKSNVGRPRKEQANVETN